MQKRSKKAVSIMTRPSRGNAVVLKDFCASAFSMALLHRIKEALPANENFAGPVLKGGALLAEYMRLNFPDRFKDVQPADYDFSMNLVQVKMYPENGVNGMIKSLAQHGFSMQEMEADNRRKNPEILDFNNKPIITLRLLFDGKKVDLVLAHRKCTAPYVAAEGDTAVSSIAADHTGVVYADPLFADDAAEGVYRVRVRDPLSMEYSLTDRFQRINQRYNQHFQTIILPPNGTFYSPVR